MYIIYRDYFGDRKGEAGDFYKRVGKFFDVFFRFLFFWGFF